MCVFFWMKVDFVELLLWLFALDIWSSCWVVCLSSRLFDGFSVSTGVSLLCLGAGSALSFAYGLGNRVSMSFFS